MKAHSRVSAVLLLTAAVAAAAGCAAPAEQQGQAEPGTGATDFAFIEGSEPAGDLAGSIPENTSSFVGVEEVPAEVQAARERFPEELPDGISWSGEAFQTDSLPRDAAIEDGVFDVAVSEYWLCAWMGEYIRAEDAGDRQRTANAVTELEKYPTLPAIAAHHQSPEAVVASVIEPAKHGDSSTLREFSKTCTSYQRANPQ